MIKPDKFGLKTIFHAVMGVIILCVGALLASLPFDLYYYVTKSVATPRLIVILRSVLGISMPLLLIYLYATKVLKMSLGDFRVRKPKNITIWVLCAAALPLAVSAFFILLTPGTFASSGFSSEMITFR
jgi:hypothetical protein